MCVRHRRHSQFLLDEGGAKRRMPTKKTQPEETIVERAARPRGPRRPPQATHLHRRVQEADSRRGRRVAPSPDRSGSCCAARGSTPRTLLTGAGWRRWGARRALGQEARPEGGGSRCPRCEGRRARERQAAARGAPPQGGADHRRPRNRLAVVAPRLVLPQPTPAKAPLSPGPSPPRALSLSPGPWPAVTLNQHRSARA
jgi:hypothetical protein